MQSPHILPALRNSYGTQMGHSVQDKKKKHQFYCLLDYIEKIRKSALKILILHAGHVW